jgi:hypothetical protein
MFGQPKSLIQISYDWYFTALQLIGHSASARKIFLSYSSVNNNYSVQPGHQCKIIIANVVCNCDQKILFLEYNVVM